VPLLKQQISLCKDESLMQVISTSIQQIAALKRLSASVMHDLADFLITKVRMYFKKGGNESVLWTDALIAIV
jgi:hypothetical protein